jgi:hypothetical protein
LFSISGADFIGAGMRLGHVSPSTRIISPFIAPEAAGDIFFDLPVRFAPLASRPTSSSSA